LNDLNELAAAINDDANYNTTLTSALATKLPLAGGTLTGTLTMGSNAISSTGTGTFGVLAVDTMTLNGSSITGSSNLTLDVAGTITIDADNAGTVYLKDNGVTYGQFFQDSGRFFIQSVASDADMLFRGSDAGNVFTALTLDMSEGGTANFGNGLNILDNDVIGLGNSLDFKLYHNSSSGINYIDSAGVANTPLYFYGNDAGSGVNALILDFANAGAATFNSSVKSAGLHSTTAGTSNFIAGVNAGNSIASGGNYNTVVGDEAGTALNTGDNNVAVGYAALDATTTGSGNVALGRNALGAQTTGTGNVGIGNTAIGTGAVTGDYNVGIGHYSISALTSGTNNAAVGTQALYVNTTGSSNVAMGRDALTANTTASNNTAIGYASLAVNTTGTDNVAVGSNALDANTTASNNTAVGDNSLGANTTGSGNSAVGADALDANTTGASNVAFGKSSLSSNTTASLNTAIGAAAMEANTTGTKNVAVGALALDANTVGALNVAVGTSALSTDTKGQNNTAIGYRALLTQNFTSATNSYNTAVGADAGKEVTTGVNNTLIGSLAGDAITTGGGNVAVGLQALGTEQAGGHNTVVGEDAQAQSNGSIGCTSIGTLAGYQITTGDNNMCLGKDAGRSGSPGGALTTGDNQICLADENVTHAYVQVDWSIASDQRDKTDFTALDLGLDFVKALAPVTYKWDKRSKYGDKKADGYDLAAQTPDGTHKEDWLDIGFKAQEVEALEIAAGYDKDNKTNLVSSHTADGKQMGLQYSKFIPILVKAIQEQQALIEALTARITTLEG